jgi:hypothetical protein
MAYVQGQLDIEGMRRLEEQLASMLQETATEVAHTDCLDDEQRAEIYTILSALQADSEMHRGMMNVLARQAGGEYVGDA